MIVSKIGHFSQLLQPYLPLTNNYRKFRYFISVSDLSGRGRKRTTRTKENVSRISSLISTDIYSSLSYISKITGIPRTGVKEIFHDNNLFSYKVDHVQNFYQDDSKKKLRFCKWYLGWNKHEDKIVWWSDECTFRLVPQTNSQNNRYRTSEQMDIVEQVKNSQIKVQVWVSISSDGRILYERLEEIQTSQTYLDLLKRQVPSMDSSNNYFQQDGGSIHKADKVVALLKSNHLHHWIGMKSSENEWPPRSPDLSPLDYLFWSYVQSKLLDYAMETQEDLYNALVLKFQK